MRINKLAGVKDDQVIEYFKKGIKDLKLFKKIHEASATTIADLMMVVNKLVNTQEWWLTKSAVMAHRCAGRFNACC